jgi:hypothetical protein
VGQAASHGADLSEALGGLGPALGQADADD